MNASNRVRLRVPIMAKSLILVLACALVPLTITWALTVPRGTRAVEDLAKRNLQVVAQVTATQLDQLFADSSRLQACLATEELFLSFCKASPSQRSAMQAQVQRRLGQVLQANSDMAMLYIADSQGICRISTGPDMVGKDYRKTRVYMREALAGKTYISDLAMGITSKEPGVFMAGPIIDSDKRLVGVLVVKLKGRVIDLICTKVTNQVPGGFAAVVDSRNVIISHPDPSMLYHSFGDLPAQALADIDPKLQYGVKSVKSLAMNALADELRTGHGQGNVAWADASGDSTVAGFATMSLRPWKIIVAQPRAMFDQPLRELQQKQFLVLAGAIIGASLLAFVFIRQVIKPIKALSRAAVRLAGGDWTARANVVSNDELGDLAHTFNDMVPKLQERTKMEDAMRLAMEIQRNLLPHGAPVLEGADVAGINVPADETGGDYYDFLDLSTWQRDTLAVAIGDVTGHGISAALLMTTARALLRSRATPPGNLAELIADVNVRLSDDTPAGRFMTLMYAVIDCRARNVRLVSAGHDPVICYSPTQDQFTELSGSDVPLAVLRDTPFTESQYNNLPDGAILVFGTDGIWETTNQAQEQYGKDRLCSLVRLHRDRPAKGIVDEILAEVALFRGQVPQQDDITVVVVRLDSAGLR